MKNRKLPIIKVMSFNIAHGLGMDGITDLERTAAVIEDSRADIIGLQEVDRFFGERSSFMDQVEWLGQRLGLHTAYGANLDFASADAGKPNQQYGNAILSKYPITYSRNHHMTPVKQWYGNDEQRGVLEAVIEIDNMAVTVFNAHLSLKDEELKLSVDEILALTERSEFPCIVMGDFNAPPFYAPIRKMTRHFTDAFLKMKNGDAYTYPSTYSYSKTGVDLKPVTRIDYIFLSPELEVVQTAAIPTDVSDHLPIVAEVVLARTNQILPSQKKPSKAKV
ncbi:endonuclease/exonuclease/phosphatase family protein [Planococcus sp. CAU13]|uniref:endonuclease/exonuclease/phosphatase family protein n=1 Tax=Planococcus sp. CAU13 TaxID=1541197 RepID=UPI00052FE710|nr:endonuclease/exonuclease/phosphatase family protein [Planococcus sp. CAU13]